MDDDSGSPEPLVEIIRASSRHIANGKARELQQRVIVAGSLVRYSTRSIVPSVTDGCRVGFRIGGPS